MHYETSVDSVGPVVVVVVAAVAALVERQVAEMYFQVNWNQQMAKIDCCQCLKQETTLSGDKVVIFNPKS